MKKANLLQTPFIEETEQGEVKKKVTFKSIFGVIKTTVKGFTDDGVTRLSAALAYATLFAIVPFFSLLITIGTFFDLNFANRFYAQLVPIVGEDVVSQIQTIVQNAYASSGSTIATIVSAGVMIFGATAIFAQMQGSLNTIWGIKPKPKKGWVKMIMNRLLSFSMILVFGFILLITFSLTALVNNFSERLSAYYPDITVFLFPAIAFIINIAITTFVFVLIFKILPDAKIKIKDVTVGAVVTTLLFLIGQYGISIYLARNNTTSVYGAAAFILILLTWIYYTSIIIYIGAEFTKAWANEMGSKIYPDEYAVSTRIVEIQDDGPVEAVNKTEVDQSSDTNNS